MSTVVPPKGSRSVTAPPTTAPSQQHSSQPAYQQNNPRNVHSHALNRSDIELNSPHQPGTPPRTPRRQQNATNGNPPETGSKQKSRGKRPKNVMTSPAMVRNGRNTPPQGGQHSAGLPQSSAKPILTPSTAAYAGPTFHASPAPSALPIPSFYSKSVPDSPGMKMMKEPFQSPPNVPPQVQVRREESPLDFFFRADREEKARARSATLTATKPTGPFLPPSGSPQTNQTSPAPAPQTRPRTSKRNSSSGMFAMELDGDGSTGSPYGPSFSTPYSERINAARPKSSFDQPSIDGRQTMTSEALKAYLFSGHSGPSPNGSPSHSSKDGITSPGTPTTTGVKRNATAPGGQKNSIAAARAQHNSMKQSSGLRQEVISPNTPTKTPDRNNDYTSSPTRYHPNGIAQSSAPTNYMGPSMAQSAPPSADTSNLNRNTDLKGMEDTLRRMLKLDSGSSSVTGSNDVSKSEVRTPQSLGNLWLHAQIRTSQYRESNELLITTC